MKMNKEIYGIHPVVKSSFQRRVAVMVKPMPPNPQCIAVDAGTREEWNQYHIDAALYYDGIVLTMEQVRAFKG